MISQLFKPNPLNVKNIRQLQHCPDYFTSVDFEIKSTPEQIRSWIYENLSGRFFLGPWVVNKDSKFSLMHRAAFEIPSEAGYFCLILPDIDKFFHQ